jgi:hypothetical protein
VQVLEFKPQYLRRRGVGRGEEEKGREGEAVLGKLANL